MRVLVDTSVWSLALRKKGPANHPGVEKLSLLLNEGEDIFITGTILQEILQAFRDARTLKTVVSHLDPIPLLPLDRTDFVEAAAIHRQCASNGITTSTTDCQIAEAAIRHDCLLLTADRDFLSIARHTDLKLV